MITGAFKLKGNNFWLCLVSILFLIACSEAPKQPQAEQTARPVKLITIEDANQARELSYPATLDAVHSSKLAFQVSGRLEKLNVIAAQTVTKGDVLAVLEQRTFINQLNATKAQFSAAQSDYNRGLTLAKDGVISARELEQLRTKKRSCKSQL